MFRKNSWTITALLFASLAQAYALPNDEQAAKMTAFKDSWTAKALKLQRIIDLKTPFNEATFIGTHNSYNSKSYEIPLTRYIDPNQLLTLYDQLEMGVRSVELDAHWTFNDKMEKQILLCHGRPTHIGCGPFDRRIEEGLQEIQKWLKANPNEVVLLYIERHLDGHEPRLANYLNAYLGNFIYKPTQIDKHASCTTIPGTLTKYDVLKAGKQLLIVGKGCDGDHPKYEEENKFPEKWSNFVFVGIGDMPKDKYTFLDETITSFLPYPDCSKSNIFYPDPEHSSMWRIFEDRTHTTNIVRKEKKLESADMVALMRCGINWPTMDMLAIDDPRLTAAVWSWAPDHPKNGNGNCAIYQSGVGIENVDCNQANISGFACFDNKSHSMHVVSGEGAWSQGEAICQMQDSRWHYTVPVNGLEMGSLKEAADQMGIESVWLNYGVNDKGEWEAKLLKS